MGWEQWLAVVGTTFAILGGLLVPMIITWKRNAERLSNLEAATKDLPRHMLNEEDKLEKLLSMHLDPDRFGFGSRQLISNIESLRDHNRNLMETQKSIATTLQGIEKLQISTNELLKQVVAK